MLRKIARGPFNFGCTVFLDLCLQDPSARGSGTFCKAHLKLPADSHPTEVTIMRNERKTVALSLATFLAVFVVLCMCLGQATPSYGIPAFARKYQTSCTTCHNNYPELNDFGEAFKKNGFKFPKDDDTFVKEPPVLLGAKAQKEAFPGAVYPGELPGNLPIAFRYSGNFTWNKKQPAGVIAQRLFLFGKIGPGVGQLVSFFTCVERARCAGSGNDGALFAERTDPDDLQQPHAARSANSCTAIKCARSSRGGRERGSGTDKEGTR